MQKKREELNKQNVYLLKLKFCNANFILVHFYVLRNHPNA